MNSRKTNHAVFETIEARNYFSAINYGDRIADTIGTAGQTAEYTFEATAGNNVTLGLLGTAIDRGFSARAQITSPSGVSTTIATDDTQHKFQNLTETGTYKIDVFDAGQTHRGNYVLALNRYSPPDPGAQPYIFGTPVDGTIDNNLVEKQYTFSAHNGDKIDLGLQGQAIDAGFSVRTQITAPDGGIRKTLAQGDFQNFNIDEDGTWLLTVYDAGLTHRGNYSLTVEGVTPASADATVIATNRSLQDAIGRNLEVDQYRVYVNAGENVGVTLAGAAIDQGFSARLSVVAPDGVSVKTFSQGNPGSFLANETGYYLFQAYDAGFTHRGNYTVQLSGLKDVTLLGSTLFVEGSAGNDHIVVSESGASVTVTRNGVATNFSRAQISRMEVYGESGDDLVDASSVTVNSYLIGGDGNDTLIGGSGNDTLSSGAGKNQLFGGAGDDRVNGSNGHDSLYGQAGADRLYGNGGNDMLDGGGGVDRLFGGDGDDLLVGGGSNDKLYGEAGNDTLAGQAGADLLDGGDGFDSSDANVIDAKVNIEA